MRTTASSFLALLSSPFFPLMTSPAPACLHLFSTSSHRLFPTSRLWRLPGPFLFPFLFKCLDFALLPEPFLPFVETLYEQRTDSPGSGDPRFLSPTVFFFCSAGFVGRADFKTDLREFCPPSEICLKQHIEVPFYLQSPLFHFLVGSLRFSSFGMFFDILCAPGGDRFVKIFATPDAR